MPALRLDDKTQHDAMNEVSGKGFDTPEIDGRVVNALAQKTLGHEPGQVGEASARC